MSELQAAVGLEQLKKLEMIVAKNRENKSVIKSIIAKATNIRFRRITDSNELADTIIFNLDSVELADKCVAKLAKVGVGTKNVPDAMRWHFNKYFTQIWENCDLYPNYNTAWSKSDDLLSRSLSLPVMVLWTEEECKTFGEKVLTVLNSL
jgi:8-amino-3,8-dideoxy-alpha-D-manno-octulosonate transaminase